MDSLDLTGSIVLIGSIVLTDLTGSIDSAEVAGTAASGLVSGSAVGAGVGPGSVSGSGIPSGSALGGDRGPHMDMVVTMRTPTATSTAIPIRGTTLRTTIPLPLRNRIINTIRTIRELQTEIG